MTGALALVSVLSTAAVADGGAAHEKLIVLGIKALDEASKKDAAVLSELVLTDLGKRASGGLEVLGESDVGEMLGFERQKQMLGCADSGGSSCLAEIGGAMGARYLLTGTLGTLGATFRIDLKLLDTKEGKAVAREGANVGAEEKLIGATRKILAAVMAPVGGLKAIESSASHARDGGAELSGGHDRFPGAEPPASAATGSDAPFTAPSQTGLTAVPDLEARKALAARCRQNDAQGCLALGKFLATGGDGVAPSCPKAAGLFWHACVLNVGEACARLAGLHAQCELPPHAPKRPIVLVRRACELGWKRACENLAKRGERLDAPPAAP